MPAILASNVTVVLALFTLVLAVIPGTHRPRHLVGDRPADRARGSAVHASATLAVSGRRGVLAFVPRPNQAVERERLARHRNARHAVVGLTAGLGLLAVVAVGLSEPRRTRPGREVPRAVKAGHQPRDAVGPLSGGRSTAHLHRRVERWSGGRRGRAGCRGRRACSPSRCLNRSCSLTVVVTSGCAPAPAESLEQIAESCDRSRSRRSGCARRGSSRDQPGRARRQCAGPAAHRTARTRDLLIVLVLLLAR